MFVSMKAKSIISLSSLKTNSCLKTSEIIDSIVFICLRFALDSLLWSSWFSPLVFLILFFILLFSLICRMMIMKIPRGITSNFFVIDPLVSTNVLKDTNSVLNHFLNVFDNLQCNIIFLPYHERYPLVSFNIPFIFSKESIP